LLESTSEFRNH